LHLRTFSSKASSKQSLDRECSRSRPFLLFALHLETLSVSLACS
jgi:hypothetical protein